jgi:hypothetical protein
MKVGHINLARSFNGTGEHFIALIEALDREGLSQHIIVRNEALARRLALYDRVSVGPTTTAAVLAYCLMPAIDVVHCHDERGAQAGLLLRLTRSVPFVLTRRVGSDPTGNPVQRAVYRRAAAVICTTHAGARSLRTFAPDCRVEVINDLSMNGAGDIEKIAKGGAAGHVQVYRRILEPAESPAVIL